MFSAPSETSSLLPLRAASSIVAVPSDDQLATEESVEVVRAPSEETQDELNNTNNGDTGAGEFAPIAQPSEETQDELNNTNNGDTGAGEFAPIAQLTRRLRCIFSFITFPVIPLGTILSFALLWVLYAAFVLDIRKSCSRPLHWYAVISLLFVSYAPHHPRIRNYLFDYSPERDRQPRPIAVRMYDQLFHTLCILYVYCGVTLLETCREISNNDQVEDVLNKNDEAPQTSVEGTSTNTCAATCPNLYQALSIYVTTLELFTFALILPLLFLPCVYLWILRRASAEAEAFSQFQDRLEEEQALLHNGGITTQEIIDSLEKVKFVYDSTSDGDEEVVIVPLFSTGNNDDDEESQQQEGREKSATTRECCICMSEFEITHSDDLETGESTNEPENLVVRTSCNHVFHASCLAGWLGGRWEPHTNEQEGDRGADGPNRSRRRARRTACPLCRKDLKPSPTES